MGLNFEQEVEIFLKMFNAISNVLIFNLSIKNFEEQVYLKLMNSYEYSKYKK